jgi:O-antigen/teichoic acid export membrane protein
MAASDAEVHSQRSTNRLVWRNTLLLVGAKILATPISVITNAVVARYLGPADYSYMYLASTYTTFGLLFVVFGQSGALPALVALERTRAGEYLGTASAWRTGAGIAVYAVLALGCWVFGYDIEFQYALALVFGGALITTVAAGGLETIRAFDRTDVDAINNVAIPLFTAAVTIPIVLLGGRLLSVLTVSLVISILSLLFVGRYLRPVGVGALSISGSAARTLLMQGAPFLLFSGALALQTTVDAAFLSHYSPKDVVGWHAAANKLIGLVVFPAAALITALYPVLCRLYADNRTSFLETTRSTLTTSIVLMVPVALCCGLFPEVGVMVLGEEGYGPIIDNLRVMAVFVFLVYVSMPLGIAILAAGRARAWSLTQALCVVISVVLDPILVPMFQRSHANGGLGICVARVISEMFMVVVGVCLLPKGVLTWRMFRPSVSSLAAGTAMAAVAWLLRDISVFVVAPAAIVVYGATLWVTGGVTSEQLQLLRSVASKKRDAAQAN